MIAVSMNRRELTLWEKREIKKLVHASCANFDKVHGCLQLDWPCYMCQKQYTGAFCLYFQNAVLPLHQELSASLKNKALFTKTCLFCQKSFVPKPKERYCCEVCRRKARQATFRKSQQKHRSHHL